MSLPDPTVGASAVTFVIGVAAARLPGEPPATTRRWTLLAAVGAVVWLKATWLVAWSGALRRFEAVPPPFAGFVVTIVVLGVGLAFSPLGTRLVHGWSLAALVGVQGFRLPLELLMHQAYEEGVMPGQMSYSGWNFDVLTGIGAILLAGALRWWRVPRWVVVAWNVLGLALLLNVVTIAIVSTPLFRWFGDDRLNTWVAYPPFVWLPAVMVLAAWAGHLLVFRKLRAR